MSAGLPSGAVRGRLRVTVHLLDRNASLGQTVQRFEHVEALDVIGDATESYDADDVAEGGRVLVVNAAAVVAIEIEPEPAP